MATAQPTAPAAPAANDAKPPMAADVPEGEIEVSFYYF
jgi:hypothetical protein